MTLSKDQFMNYNLHEMYALHCDANDVVNKLQAQLSELETQIKKDEDIKFEMAKEIEHLKKRADYFYEVAYNQDKMLHDLQKQLEEKQLIVDAKKFADFKPIDNSRVGMTTPTMQEKIYPWTALQY